MAASATLLYNAGGYAGQEWRESLGVPVKGLKSPRNRAFLATLGANAEGWVNSQRQQGIRPCLVVSGISERKQMWALAEKFGSGIDYQVENEGDDPKSGLHATPAEIGRRARMLNDAVDGLKLDCTVILGAVQGIGINGGGYRYLHEMFDGWGDYYPRAVAFNCYPTVAEIPLIASWVHQLRGVLCSRDAQHAEVWNGEWGIRNDAGLGHFTFRDEREQGALVRAVLRQFDAAGVAESFMWAADDTSGFGFKDRAALKRIWNASVRAVA